MWFCMNNYFFKNWRSYLTGWAHASVWLTAVVPKEKWMWVFICDCFLLVTTLTALAHKAGDKNKILESHTTLLGEIRAQERAVSPYQAPAPPGLLGRRGLEPSTICQGALGFAHVSYLSFRAGNRRAERSRATGKHRWVPRLSWMHVASSFLILCAPS